ncbi:MAG: hypothetical protein AAGH53_10180 [Pseudomonadota bacterium]
MKALLALPLAFAPLAMIGVTAPLSAQQAATSNAALDTAMAAPVRDKDRARDQYRHPVETLAFFQVTPEQTVVEYAPGGGWYTRLLAPYIGQSGRYIAINADTEGRSFRNRASEARAKGWTENFPERVAEWTGMEAEKVLAFESDEVPEDIAGTIDRVLIFRSIHGLLNGNRADSELRAIHAMLSDDGMVGVVQHRAKADAPHAVSSGPRGYVKQDYVVKLFELNGFELVDSSEINANPKDPANWEGGVWTLPPILRFGDEDRERYLAIGESDRMTLLFRKTK